MKKKLLLVLGSEGRVGKNFCNFFNKKENFNVVGLDNIVTQNLDYDNIKVDIHNEKSLLKIIEKVKKKYGEIDFVVNCVYPSNKSWGQNFDKISKKNLDRHFSSHLSCLIIVVRSFIRQFLNQGHGRFIFLSSIQGLGAPKFEHYKGTNMNSCIEYSIIKAGIINMTKYLSKFYKGKNINFNCISLGGIRSGQTQRFQKNYKNSCLNKGLLDPNDINSALEFLISDGSKFINGQNIVVDDGWSL